jgi:hypothetical protein
MRIIFTQFELGPLKLELIGRIWKSQALRRFHDCNGAGGGSRVGERDLDPKSSPLLRHASGQTVQLDRGAPFRVAGNPYFSPSHSPGPRQSLHRFIDRLLGRDPGSGMTGGVRAGPQVFTLAVGEEFGHGVVALIGQKRPDPLQIDQIDPNSHYRHRCAHQNSARPCRGPGTGRYPPSTRPR